MNELANLQFTVDYTPSKLTIANEAELADLVNKTAASYASMVFTDANIGDAKKARSELNKIKKIISDKRIEVKRDYSRELDAFEASMKDYASQIENVANGITVSLNVYEAKERGKREAKINLVIQEMITNSNINAEELSIDVEKEWLTATAFTKSGEPTLKTLKDMQSRVGWQIQQAKQKATDLATITKFAELNKLVITPWTMLLDAGNAVDVILAEMDEAVQERESKIMIAEQRKKEQEEQRAKQIAEAVNVDDKKVDADTGEILAEPEVKLMTFNLQVTGTFEQLSQLNAYMRANGIEFVKIGG